MWRQEGIPPTIESHARGNYSFNASHSMGKLLATANDIKDMSLVIDSHTRDQQLTVVIHAMGKHSVGTSHIRNKSSTTTNDVDNT